MIDQNFLQGITVLDFTQRLPGPYSTHLLSNLGAKVIKIEHANHRDAFLRGHLASIDNCFPSWYEELNENKEVLILDFDKKEDQKKISELANDAQIIISSLPSKVEEKLSLKNTMNNGQVYINLKASKESHNALHDLNALCETGILKLFISDKSDDILAPPFLPIAGSAFGHKIATECLAALYKAQVDNTKINHSVYLFETTKELFDRLWPKKMREQKRTKFLHNGLYPCYSLYKTKDNQFMALAAIEEKYWMDFSNCFELNLTSSERFCTEDKVFKRLSTFFKSQTQEEILMSMKDKFFCLSAV